MSYYYNIKQIYMRTLQQYINESKNTETISKIRKVFFDRSGNNGYFDEINLSSGVLTIRVEDGKNNETRFFPWFDMVKLRNEFKVKKLIIESNYGVRIDLDSNGTIEDIEIEYINNKSFGKLDIRGLKKINKVTLKGQILVSSYGAISPRAESDYKINFDYQSGTCKNPGELESINNIFKDAKKLVFSSNSAFFANIKIDNYLINLAKDFGYNVGDDEASKIQKILNQLPKDIPIAPDYDHPDNSYIVGKKIKAAPEGFRLPPNKTFKNIYTTK